MLQRRNVLYLLASLALGGCSGSHVAAVAEEGVTSFAGPGPQRGAGGAYMLGPGDRLRIKVYNEPELTGEYEVNSSGFISLPLVGQVKASGTTTSQLERNIAAKMKGQISQDPKVNVEIAAYAPFYIYGEVKKAGEYPYRPGLTMADAVATAGGLTYRANEDRIYLRRAGSAVEEMVSLNMPVRVYPGDNIRVDERIF
jgi:polysaccharide export outer membrane protein